MFELRITVMLYLDFQSGIVLQNFHVCGAFFETVRDITVGIDTFTGFE